MKASLNSLLASENPLRCSANRKPMINQKTTKPEGHSDERNFPCRKSDIVERKFWFLLKLLIFCYWRLLTNW